MKLQVVFGFKYTPSSTKRLVIGLLTKVLLPSPRKTILDSLDRISPGNKSQLMARSLLREVTEPAVFVLEVAKQHDVFVRAIAS